MVSVNLIPKRQQVLTRRRRHLRRWLYATMSVGLLLAFACADAWLSKSRAAELRVEYDEVAGRASRLLAEIKELTLASERAGLQVERADALRSKRPWSGILKLIDTCMPESCWLISLSTDPAQPTGSVTRLTASKQKPESVTIETPKKLKLVGYAAGPAQPYVFVSRLQKEAVFATVYLTRVQRQPFLNGTYFRFELECEW